MWLIRLRHPVLDIDFLHKETSFPFVAKMMQGGSNTNMSCYITFRGINVNVSSQNAGVFVGDIRIPGWDSNQKVNSAHAAIYGFSNLEATTVNVTVDSQELVDGMINDQDIKPVWGTNV